MRFPSDILGKTDYDLFSPEVADRLTAIKQTYLQSGKSGHTDVMIDHEGLSWTIRLFIEPFRDLTGAVAGITVAGIDLTDILQIKEVLQISEEKYRALFDETNDICFVFTVLSDTEGNTVDFILDDLNRQVLTLMGREKHELIGSHLSTFRPEIDPGWFESLKQVSVTGSQICFEGFSEYFQLHVSVNVYPVGVGRIGVVIRDISDLNRVYQQIEYQRDLALSLLTTTDLDEAINQILNAGMHIPGIDSGGIYFITDDQVLHLRAHRGLSPEFIDAVRRVPSTPAITEAFHSGTPIYYSSGDLSPARTPNQVLSREGLRAYLAIPILNKGRCYAILNLGSHILDAIPLQERPYLESLGAHLGEILARLNHETDISGANHHPGIRTYVQILNSDGKILEGSAPYDEQGYAPVSIKNLIQGEKERLHTGNEVSGVVISGGSDGETYRIRIRFVPWDREVAYLAIGERFL